MQHDPILSEDECWALLATATVGRLALSVRALPAILPVEYYADEVDLVISMCLGEFDVPVASGNDAIVAFSVDDIDAATRSGWSIQVVGRSRFHSQDGTLVDCGNPAGGRIMSLEPAHVMGQRLHLCPFVVPMTNTEL
jgi:nitroimidazol reductase NimA-like FMN-containing flavoprotein (pyridoxamine 5'-phosphate oxidase superfamily)